MTTAPLFDLVEAMADQIRDALDTALSSTDLAVQVEPRRVLRPTPPTVDIYPADDFRDIQTASMGLASGGYRFTVRARVDTGDADVPQDLLVEMQDDESAMSVAEALLSDPTLGGYADDLTIEAFSGHRLYQELEGGALLGCEWTVLVLRAYS